MNNLNLSNNLRSVYDALRGLCIGDCFGYGDVHPLMAEMEDYPAAWYVLQITPAQERIAAGHLIGRRFGVFMPEVEQIRLKRGARRRILLPMFPGYCFIFTWLTARNYHRIKSSPGVYDFLCIEGQPALMADHIIDAVRAVENKQRPLVTTQEGIGMPRKVKRGWRRNRRLSEQMIADNEIVGVHTWSALHDALRLDGAARNRLLHEVLGLA